MIVERKRDQTGFLAKVKVERSWVRSFITDELPKQTTDQPLVVLVVGFSFCWPWESSLPLSQQPYFTPLSRQFSCVDLLAVLSQWIGTNSEIKRSSWSVISVHLIPHTDAGRLYKHCWCFTVSFYVWKLRTQHFSGQFVTSITQSLQGWCMSFKWSNECVHVCVGKMYSSAVISLLLIIF